MHIKQTMVLAAGFGKRLLPLTLTCPKPLAPLNGRPLLDYTFDHIHEAGLQKCVVNTHYLSDQIQNHLQRIQGPIIHFSHEPELLETGGGITKALPFFENHPFFSINGDIWWTDKEELALKRLDRVWDDTKMDVLLLLVERSKALGYTGKGDYFCSIDEGKITYRKDKDYAPYVYGGLQILHPRLFEGCTVEPFSILELYHKAEKKGRLYGLIHTGDWGDIQSLNALKLIERHMQK